MRPIKSVSAIVLLSATTFIHAQTVDIFTGLPSGGSTTWGTAGNWSLGRPPMTGEDGLIRFNDSNDRRITFDQSATGQTLTLVNNGGGQITLVQNAGFNLNFAYENIGAPGSNDSDPLVSGSFIQTGGTNSATVVNVGGDVTYSGVGSYSISGGTLSTSTLEVGKYNTGVFTQTGGTVLTGDMGLGYLFHGNGTYNLSAGTFHATGRVYVGGDNGNGTFNQSGGSVQIDGDLRMGYSGGGGPRGTYLITSNATVLHAASESLGDHSTGVIIQSAGTNQVDGVLSVGYVNTGMYQLSGGSLTAGALIVGSSVSVGTLTQTGGSVTVGSPTTAGTFTMASQSTYALSGGSSSLTVYGSGSIGQYGSADVFTQSSGAALFTGTLTLRQGGQYQLSGGTLTAAAEALAAVQPEGSSFPPPNGATFFQSGGTNQVDGELGVGSLSSYTLSNGTLSADYINVGGSTFGAGQMTQTGGTATTSALYLSRGGGAGTYNFSDGSLTTGETYLGYYGQGRFNQTGGTHHASNIEVGYDDFGEGTYSISGSQSILSSDFIRVGYHSPGHFLQSGGSVSTSDLTLGQTDSAEYVMSGGSLSVSQRFAFSSTARGDYNRFIQTGGSVVVGSATTAASLNFGGGGTYSLSGASSSLKVYGDASIGQHFGPSVYDQSAGVATFNGTMDAGGAGTATLRGGSLSVGTIQVDANGSFLWQSGSLSVGTVTANGAMALSPSATSSLKTLRVKSLSISNTNGNNGKVDLADNKLVVDYTSASGALDTLRSELHAITLVSSTADSRHAIGYGDNAVLHKSSWGDQTFAANQQSEILAGLTYLGDTNLDGKVDIVDLGLLAAHWQGNGYWTDGDLNYDGKIDIVDLGLLAGNWQQGSTSTQSFADALAGFNLSQTPEPAALAAAATLLILNRRNRRNGA